jgi:hypothetical protein
MKSIIKKIANSAWIDDLSEEEQKMLTKTHAIDEKMRKAKLKDMVKNLGE